MAREGFEPNQNSRFSEQPGQDAPDEEGHLGVDRRAFLAASVGGLSLARAFGQPKKGSTKTPERSQKVAVEEKPHNPWEPHCKMGKLAGRKFAGLYTEYTGISGEVPETAKINFPHQLKTMWHHKVETTKALWVQTQDRAKDQLEEAKREWEKAKKSKAYRPDQVQELKDRFDELTQRVKTLADRAKTANTQVEELGKSLHKEYESTPPKSETLEGYVKVVRNGIAEVRANLDWKKFGEMRKMDLDKLALLREMAGSVKAEEMLGYALTELMPSEEGELNVEVFELLLRNGGSNYIESIPAEGDQFVSDGPYQLSSPYAVYDDEDSKRFEIGRASLVNRAMRAKKIPNNMTQVRGIDHHKAAYMMMIYNFSRLINQCSKKQLKVLKGHWRQHPTDSVYFAAVAHHTETKALAAANRWLDNGAKLPFEVSCGDDETCLYAKKTGINLRALSRRLTHKPQQAIRHPSAKR